MVTNNGFEIGLWRKLALTSDAGSAAVISAVAPVLATAANGGLTFANGLATMICQANHGLYEGQMVCIYGATDPGYDCYAPAHIIGPLTFSYPLPGAATSKWVGGQPQGPGSAPNLGTLIFTPSSYTVATSPDAGNAKVSTLKVRKAIITASTANGGNFFLGPQDIDVTPFVLTSAPTAIKLGAGSSFDLSQADVIRGEFAGCLDLAQFCFKADATSSQATILYLAAERM
jgi:hypothetical protein